MEMPVHSRKTTYAATGAGPKLLVAQSTGDELKRRAMAAAIQVGCYARTGTPSVPRNNMPDLLHWHSRICEFVPIALAMSSRSCPYSQITRVQFSCTR